MVEADQGSPIPPVRRVDTIEELVACFEGNTPCISSHLGVYDFENLTDDKWIADNVGDCNIRFRRPTNRKVIDPSDSIKEIAIALQTHKSSLRKFVQSEDNTLVLTGVETHVLKKGEVISDWKPVWEIANQVVLGNDKIPAIVDRERLSNLGFWMSKGPLQTITHFDNSFDNNLNFQIRGEKELLLFPHSDWRKLKTFSALSLHPFSFFSEIKKGGKYESLNPQLAKLKAGDVLFLPSTWYHFVEHKSESNLNLTFWFKPDHKVNPKSRVGNSVRNPWVFPKLFTANTLSKLLKKHSL